MGFLLVLIWNDYLCLLVLISIIASMKLNGIDLTLNEKRRRELREDDSYIHIMKYMGSKRELLPEIKKTVQSMINRGDTVLDIFAGTASVGAYLKNDYNIYSNDVQKYSQTIAQAIIESSSLQMPKDIQETIFQIHKQYIKNKEILLEKLKNTFAKSNYFVLLKKGEWNEMFRKDYLKFFDSFPSPDNKFKTQNIELKWLKNTYFENSQSLVDNGPYCQTTFLFSETYFSLEQAIDIDSLRYAIEVVIEDKVLKSIFLSALMYAYSYCSSGTGHFAMFRDLTTLSAVEDVFIYRKKDVLDYFIRKVHDLIEYHMYLPEKDFRTFSEDYKLLLEKDFITNVDLIYADPPYSFVHYSRFYHAVESLVKYDYDIPKYKGRYRCDRHQSPFCQKQNVEQAFNYLFEKAADKKCQVLLSYSDTGMISLEKIQLLIEKHGFKFQNQEIVYNHSTMGRKGHKSNKIKEYLIKATF